MGTPLGGAGGLSKWAHNEYNWCYAEYRSFKHPTYEDAGARDHSKHAKRSWR